MQFMVTSIWFNSNYIFKMPYGYQLSYMDSRLLNFILFDGSAKSNKTLINGFSDSKSKL